MFKNYFKIAIAVLKRRKFFTFISLFGISFTLTILVVIAAFFDHLFSAGYPDTERDRSLYIDRIELHSEKEWNWTGPPSYYFLSHFISKMRTPSRIAISSSPRRTNVYVANKKLPLLFKYTNDQFWDVLKYEFVEGKPYNRQEVESAQRVVVISEAARDKYFGSGQQVVGKYIEADNVQHRVIGVVKDVPSTLPHVYSELYMPHTVAKRDLAASNSLIGNFSAILLANSKGEVQKMSEEYTQIASRVPLPGKEYDKMYTHADTYFVGYMRNIFGDGETSGLKTFYAIMSIFVFLFLLLPTVNLVNINISRIMERYSEIGVRKAFGASSRTLVLQFVVENIILTCLGGLIGIVLATLLIAVFNGSEMVPNAHLAINTSVLGYCILTCFVFGIISGVYPAWRMSRMQVVTALKAS